MLQNYIPTPWQVLFAGVMYVGVEIYNAINTADLFDLINYWFDVQNSKFNTNTIPTKQPYGKTLKFKM